MKDLLLTLAILVAAGSGFFLYKNYQETADSRKTLEVERYNRMKTEESLHKANIKVKELESSVKAFENRIKKVQRVLDETQAENEELQDEVLRTAQAKLELERQLRSSLEAQTQIITSMAREDLVAEAVE